MRIPLVYSLRSLEQRWSSSVVAVLGIAGAVSVLVAMLAMARGFSTTLESSGSADTAIVMRAGATSEIYSSLRGDQAGIISEAPGVARDSTGPLASAEVVELATFSLRKTGSDANVQVRGVSPRVMEVRETVRLQAGRMFTPGLPELVVGRNVPSIYVGLDLGRTVAFGGGTWTVVGVLDAGSSAFDSEIWCDAAVLNQVFERAANVFQSVTVRLASPSDLQRFSDALSQDPRLAVQVERERDYYLKTSRTLATVLQVLGLLVASVIGIGAVLAAVNTMLAALAERSREIATLRALGFRAGSVVGALVLEAMAMAMAGGVLGCVAALPVHGATTEVMNWTTVSHVAFTFRITPGLLAGGIAFALLMGLLGGVPPAVRAVRRPVALALREL